MNNQALYPDIGNILATNAFFYYEQLERVWLFYRDILGFETVADYGFAKIMRVAQSSYVTLVDADSGKHDVTEPKSVTLAMVTDQVTAWYDYLVASGVPMQRELEIRAGSPHDGFVALDPEGYFLEFECFNSHEENILLLPLLSGLQIGLVLRPGRVDARIQLREMDQQGRKNPP